MQSSRCTSEKVEGTSLEFYFRGVNREVLVLSADGGLGSDTAAHFVDELKELIRGGATKLLIDCTQLTHISSLGLGILVRLHHTMAKQGGDVKLAAVRSLVVDLLGHLNLDRLFDIYPDVDSAMEAFDSEREST